MAEDVRAALRHAAERMLVACQLESETMYARTLAEVDATLTALPAQLQDAALERWQWPPIVAHAVIAVARRTPSYVVDHGRHRDSSSGATLEPGGCRYTY